MRVVDPHVHFWDTHVVSYPWLANPVEAYSGDNRLLPQRYDVAAYLKDAQDFDVVGTVNIEGNPIDPVAEARWLQSLADDPVNRGQPAGIIAYADLSRDDAPAVLARLSDFANLRGIRQILNRHANPRYNYVTEDYLSNPTWRENLRRLADYGWSFDLQIYPAQNPEEFVSHYVADHPPILGKLPEIRSVLCYLPVAQTASGVLPPADYMVGNEVVFDSPEAFNAAMASPVRLELRTHFRNFPPFTGKNTHYPMMRRQLPGRIG